MSARPVFARWPFIDSDAEAAWAEDWIATCFETADRRSAAEPAADAQIPRAHRHAAPEPGRRRTLTDFCATVQDADVRDALRPYTLGNPSAICSMPVPTASRARHLTVFELDEVMRLGPRGALPVLLVSVPPLRALADRRAGFAASSTRPG